MYEEEAQAVVGGEVIRNVAPGALAALVVRDAAYRELSVFCGDFLPGVEKKLGAHPGEIFCREFPVVVAIDGKKPDPLFFQERGHFGEHPEVRAMDGPAMHAIPSEKHDVAMVLDELAGDPLR